MTPATRRRSTRPVDPSVRKRTAEFELPEFLLRHRKAVRIALHCVLIPWGYLLAFGLRFDFAIEERYLDAMWMTLPALLVARLAAFGVFRVYNGWWRHTGLYDLVDLARAITVGSMLFVAALFLTRLTGIVPRSILLLEWGVAIVNFGGIRFTVRWFQETRRRGTREGRRALIVGADDTAATFIREIRKNPRSGIDPIGLVDDDPLKASLQLHGVSVLGTTADLHRLAGKHQIRLIVVAIPNPTRQVMRKIAERCAHAGVELKLVPTLSELLHGTARIGQLQPVLLEDLLGRSPVTLGLEQVGNDIGGRVVLITGGAGSIGSELARQVSAFRPARLILVEQAESPLYFIHLELARKHPELEIVPVVADVTNRTRLEAIFADYRPDYVFHAAAYKHVPMLETNVAEAMRNNICGTLITAQLSARHGVGKFVLISTDKAVKPSSVMG
ncbi:MAG: polysaccharide biosynthesis protein, partial [Longimicrobiales bacterium]